MTENSIIDFKNHLRIPTLNRRNKSTDELGFGALSSAVMGEYRERMFKNVVLRKVFGNRRYSVA